LVLHLIYNQKQLQMLNDTTKRFPNAQAHKQETSNAQSQLKETSNVQAHKQETSKCLQINKICFYT
jgi:hypothetical protein